jgi:hypothetical protein
VIPSHKLRRCKVGGQILKLRRDALVSLATLDSITYIGALESGELFIWTHRGKQHIAKAMGKPGIPSAPR